VQGKPADPAQLQVVGVQYYDILVLYGADLFFNGHISLFYEESVEHTWKRIEVVITSRTRNQHGLLPAKEPQTRMNQGLSDIRISCI
jgi:hypothetical protein